MKTICEHCKKEIKDNEQRFSIIEHILKPKKILVNKHFHSRCWTDHYNDSLDKKVENYAKNLMNITGNTLRQIMDGRKDGGATSLITIK
jgi:hypothetical protein